jgi:hypothetical protein
VTIDSKLIGLLNKTGKLMAKQVELLIAADKLGGAAKKNVTVVGRGALKETKRLFEQVVYVNEDAVKKMKSAVK